MEEIINKYATSMLKLFFTTVENEYYKIMLS